MRERENIAERSTIRFFETLFETLALPVRKAPAFEDAYDPLGGARAGLGRVRIHRKSAKKSFRCAFRVFIASVDFER